MVKKFKKCEDEFIGVLYKDCFNKVSLLIRTDYENVFVKAKDNLNYLKKYVDSSLIGGVVSIILESPHKKEFFKEEKKFYINKNGKIYSRPGNGATGENIRKYFNSEKINSLVNIFTTGYLIYPVVLMNSVQYQCSLGKPTKEYRDIFWIKTWMMKKDDFINRLKIINPEWIFNCCTVGKHVDGNSDKLISNKYLENTIGLKKIANCNYKKCEKKLITYKKYPICIHEIVELEIYTKYNICFQKNYFKYNHPCIWHKKIYLIKTQLNRKISCYKYKWKF